MDKELKVKVKDLQEKLAGLDPEMRVIVFYQDYPVAFGHVVDCDLHEGSLAILVSGGAG